MGYTEVFGGTNIYPADVSYLALALTAPIDLDWPMESTAPPYPMARIIDVIGNGPHKIRLPDATQGSVGAITLFNLLTASSGPCFVTDHAGNTIATLGVGEQWEIYLSDNGTAAGVWRVFRFGASTATVQPSALAGYGLKVTGSTLSQSVPVTTFTGSPRDALASDRASAMVWTGAGSGTLNLPGVTSVGNNFFLSARNAGGGMLTLDPNGDELIDGGANVMLTPGEGVVLVTDGLVWYTLGRGQAAVFAFDYTAINVAPGPTYTLTGSELNRIAYRFEGELTTNTVVILPSTIQQYWIDNATTGSFSLSVNTATGIPVPLTRGSRGIYYCNGSSVIDADTSGIAIPVNADQGGTGQISYAVGDMLTASSPTTLARLAAAPVGNALIAKGSGTMPAWGQVDLGSSVTGVLPPGRGGTGATAFSAGSVVFSGPNGVYAQDNANFFFNDTTNNLGVGNFAPAARVHASVPDGSLGFGVNGPTKGLRIVPSATGVSIEGVDQTLTASYQPLAITGTSVGITANGGAGYSIALSGPVISNGTLTAAAGLFTTQTTVNTSTDNFGVQINFTGGLTGSNGPALLFTEVDGSAAAVNGGMVKSVCVNGAAGTSTMDMAFWTRFNGVFAERMRLSGNGTLTVNGQTVLTSGSSITGFLSNAVDAMVPDVGGYARFYFQTGGTTYHISPTGHNFRVGGPGGPDPVTIDGSGNLSCTATITGATISAGTANVSGTITGGTVTSTNNVNGANVFGAATVGTNNGAAGNAILQIAAATQTGIVAFLRSDGARHGYLGYATGPTGALNYQNDQGGGHNFGGGNISTDGAIYLGNERPVFWKDTGGGTPYINVQSDNTFAIYGTGSAGGVRAMLYFGTRTDNPELTVNGSIGLAAAGMAYKWRDTAGTQPQMTLQTDNNLVFYGTGSTGALRPIWAVNMRSDTAPFGISTSATVGGTLVVASDITATNGNVTAYSDERLKTNIETIEDALDKVQEMRGVTFDRIEGGDHSSGVIAQELEEVAPELVMTHEDGMKSVAYGNLVGYLIEAIKELRIEVAQLREDAGL